MGAKHTFCLTCGSYYRDLTRTHNGSHVSGTLYANLGLECPDPFHKSARAERLVKFTGYTTKYRKVTK